MVSLNPFLLAGVAVVAVGTILLIVSVATPGWSIPPAMVDGPVVFDGLKIGPFTFCYMDDGGMIKIPLKKEKCISTASDFGELGKIGYGISGGAVDTVKALTVIGVLCAFGALSVLVLILVLPLIGKDQISVLPLLVVVFAVGAFAFTIISDIIWAATVNVDLWAKLDYSFALSIVGAIVQMVGGVLGYFGAKKGQNQQDSLGFFNMLFLVGALVVVIGTILLIVGVATPAWSAGFVITDKSISMTSSDVGPFKSCMTLNEFKICASTEIGVDMGSVKAMTVIGLMSAFGAIVVLILILVLPLIGKDQIPILPFVAVGLAGGAFMFTLIGDIIWISEVHKELEAKRILRTVNVNFSFLLSVIGAILLSVGGALSFGGAMRNRMSQSVITGSVLAIVAVGTLWLLVGVATPGWTVLRLRSVYPIDKIDDFDYGPFSTCESKKFSINYNEYNDCILFGKVFNATSRDISDVKGLTITGLLCGFGALSLLIIILVLPLIGKDVINILPIVAAGLGCGAFGFTLIGDIIWAAKVHSGVPSELRIPQSFYPQRIFEYLSYSFALSIFGAIVQAVGAVIGFVVVVRKRRQQTSENESPST